jgi:hypothetical protein
MSRPSRQNIVWIVVGLMLAGPALAAEESPLAQLPADSSVVIQLHGIERTRDRLVAFVKNALPDLAPMVQAKLEEVIKVEGRKFNGLNKEGPHFLIFTELPMPGGAKEPKLALVLRADNYQDFVKGFLKEDEAKTLKPTKDGYDVATVDSEDSYFVDRKGYVFLTPNQDLAKQLAKGGPGFDSKLKKEMAKKLLDADVSEYLDMAAINKQYGPQIQASRQMIGLFTGQAAEQLGKSTAELIKEVVEGLFQYIEDSTAVLFTAEFRPDGLAFRIESRVGEETKTNGWFKAAKKSSFENLGKLPTGQLGYGGMSLTGPTGKMYQLMTHGIPSEDTKVKEAMEESEKAGPELWTGSFQLPPEGVQVIEYKEPAKAAAAQLKLMQGLKEGETFISVVLKAKPEVKSDAENYHGFKLNYVSMVWDLDKTIEKQGGQQLPEEMRKQMAEATKIFMGEGAKTWFGTDGKSYVQISAKDWGTAKGYLDQYLEGKSAIKDQKAYQETRKQLPAEATMIGLVDSLPYAQKMGEYLSALLKAMPTVPFPVPKLPAEVKGNPAYLGMAVTLESGSGGLDFWLPATAVAEVRKLVEAAMKGGE